MDSKEVQTTIDANAYDNVLKMINSVDTENRVVALTALDNVDFNKSLSYLLLFKKQGNASGAEWAEHAPKVTGMLKGIGINTDSVLTFKQILEIMVKRKVPVEDIQFYLNRFGDHLFNSIKNLGYNFIDTLEIKIKLKTEDGEQSTTITEGDKTTSK